VASVNQTKQEMPYFQEAGTGGAKRARWGFLSWKSRMPPFLRLKTHRLRRQPKVSHRVTSEYA
jgi:hypothetical protein